MESSSDIDWRLEYAERVFAGELEAMHKLKDRVTYIVGLFVTPLCGAILFLYSEFRGDIFDVKAMLLFALPLGLSVALIVLGVGQVFVILRKGHAYLHPAAPSKISAWYKSLPERSKTLSVLKEKLLDEYEKAIDHNAYVNRMREAVLVRAQMMMSWAFPFVIIASLFSFYQSLGYVAPPIQVEIVPK